MPPRGDKVIVTIRLFAGDRERLQRFYPTMNYNNAIRQIVHRHLNSAEETYNREVIEKHKPPTGDIDVKV